MWTRFAGLRWFKQPSNRVMAMTKSNHQYNFYNKFLAIPIAFSSLWLFSVNAESIDIRNSGQIVDIPAFDKQKNTITITWCIDKELKKSVDNNLVKFHLEMKTKADSDWNEICDDLYRRSEIKQNEGNDNFKAEGREFTLQLPNHLQDNHTVEFRIVTEITQYGIVSDPVDIQYDKLDVPFFKGESKIFTAKNYGPEIQAEIIRWLQEAVPDQKFKNFELLYSASHDVYQGFTHNSIYNACKSQQNTFVIAQTSAGDILGGYLGHVGWNKGHEKEAFIKSDTSFIFSFETQKKKKKNTLCAWKYDIKPDSDGKIDSHAIGFHKNYIIKFGESDIVLANECNKNNHSYSELLTYESLYETNSKYLARSKNFRVYELEIWKVS
eukprot:316568_1